MMERSIHCWICKGPLQVYTIDGVGHVGCPKCRPEIEAMQAELARYRIRYGPKKKVVRVPKHRCACGAGLRKGKICGKCRTEQARLARIAAAAVNEQRRQQRLLEAAEKTRRAEERASARAAKLEARRQSRQLQCSRCPGTYEWIAKGRKPSTPVCPTCRSLPPVPRAAPAARRPGTVGRVAFNTKPGTDTRAAVKHLRELHPTWSQRQIADVCGVTNQRVSQILNELKKDAA
jgi:hypothetical protein